MHANKKKHFRFSSLSIGNHNADYEEMQDVMNNLEKMDIRSRSDCNRWLIKNHPDKIRNLRAREAFDIQKFTDVIKWCKKLKANEAKNRRR
jgi:hypothetical protein